jgi:type I restriction enzyme M protein
MLDSNTKRRIDTARDILVGKVPDPKSQVEQITIAMIYKFMDDMDADAEELGGSRKFFSGEFGRYGWAKLMRSGLGGHETLNLYAEAITKMPENPGIPKLFRSIFKNAYLPYRDPETLRMFLKVIDEFEYDHTERIGDAFEYLLSVLGSQGDAGQFRTPRHIIDFIVGIVDPKKTDVVLDPACGTAGFLISSYKHIRQANTDKNGCCSLTPDERGRLASNFRGYDISPDMVRLSLVNMYLHGFADPHIYEYDTLTSQDHWNEYADVILANPPFMSPKGGIKPHNRFSVQSKRSEVLFVDYMAEHLTPSGRAGIIVPEGIIFQSQTAYTQLRKMLVEDYLVAVVSLPAGVFQPYSGVKTSVLILDKALAKQTSSIGFFKIENDGFGLGAQRRPIDKDDLPQARTEIAEFLHRLRARESVQDFQPTLGLVVPKETIAANGEYNLSGERYRVNVAALTKFPFRAIRDVSFELRAGFASGQSSIDTVGVPHVRPMNIDQNGQFVPEGMKFISVKEYEGREEYRLEAGDVLFNNTNSAELVGKTCLIEAPLHGGFSNHMTRIRVNPDLCVPRFLALILHNTWRKGIFADRATRWVGQAGINAKSLGEFEIPLPPLDVQKEIVAEIEGYQKVIDGARVVLDNYRPFIPIHPDWPMVELGELCSFKNGLNYAKASVGQSVKIVGVANFQNSLLAPLDDLQTIFLESEINEEYLLKQGDILFVRSNGNPDLVGRSLIIPQTTFPVTFSGFTIRGRFIDNRALPMFYALFFKSLDFAEAIKKVGRGANIRNLSQSLLTEMTVPLPPSETQKSIVAEIEAEQALVNANRELIARMEKKIQATLARVWGEEVAATAEV